MLTLPFDKVFYTIIIIVIPAPEIPGHEAAHIIYILFPSKQSHLGVEY